MRHNIETEGSAFRLRPIGLSDASLVIKLRTSDPERNKYLHEISSEISEQEDWLNCYFARQGDYYWVIERRHDHRADGLIAIYNVEQELGCAEWGRWVLRSDSLAAVESALLIYRLGFDNLGLQRMHCATVIENKQVLSFHDSCGLRRTAVLASHFSRNGRQVDAVRHEVMRSEWPTIERRLQLHADMIAKRYVRM